MSTSDNTNSDNTNQNLITFLTQLTDSIQTNTITQHNLQLIGEFHMSYKLHQTRKHKNNGGACSVYEEFSEENILRFITLGWYAYIHLLSERDTNQSYH